MNKKHISRRGFVALSGTVAGAAFPTMALADEVVDLDEEPVGEGQEDPAGPEEGAQDAEEPVESHRADESGLGLLVTDLPEVQLGETQKIALLGEDDFGTLASATVSVLHTASGEERDLPSTDGAENALLVPFAYDDASLAGQWQVERASLRWTDGRETAFVPSDSMEPLCFTFLAAQSDADQSAPTPEEPAFVAEDQTGTVVAEETLGEAADTAAEAVEAQGDAEGVMTPAVFFSGASMRQTANLKNCVAIDPGHGGWDSGATGNGLKERDLTWKISQYCIERLQQLKVPYYLTVPQSEFMNTGIEAVSIADRVARAVQNNAKAVISLHINAGGGTGFEVLVPTDSTYNYQVYVEGQQIGQKVANQLALLGLTNRGLKTKPTVYDTYPDGSKQDWYGILRYARQEGICGIIVEHGFIDNVTDAAFLAKEANLKKLGYADANAIHAQWPELTQTATPIMGSSSSNREGLARYFASQTTDSRVAACSDKGGIKTGLAFGYAIWDQAVSEGVRPEVLLAQVAVETGWLKFGGQVKATQCNFGGIGATDGGAAGATFPNIKTGLLAQAQHLKAYASTASLNNACVDPRFSLVSRGCAPNVENLGNGKWASDPDYASKLLTVLNSALTGAAKYKDTALSYDVHQQSYGWRPTAVDNEVAGVTGQSKRLEALKVRLPSTLGGSVVYQAHVQDIGWQGEVRNGELAGTTGRSLRVEALKVRLEGTAASQYDIYYRTHRQTFGWSGWAKNGAACGSQGYSKRVEAIQLHLVAKNGAAPGSTSDAFRAPLVRYRTHVQTYGWQADVDDGATSGTTGQSKRLEGIQIRLPAAPYGGQIQYRTHVQTYGWETGWKSNGATSGTTGESKRLEAIQIKLTGEMAERYDVYYRTHRQTFGWSGWAKNGASCGSAGYSKRLEGIQIKLVQKGGAAPGSTSDAFRQR